MRLLITTLVVSITAMQVAGFQQCDIRLCSYCHKHGANCATKDKLEVIPQGLSRTIMGLKNHFGPTSNHSVQLNRSMLIRYPHLHTIKLSGKFSSVAPDALVHLIYLKTFAMVNTQISALAPNLFKNNSKLEYLELCGNRLTALPIDAFSTVTYPQLYMLLVADNQVSLQLPCSNQSLQLPKELSRFHQLRVVSFTNNHFSGANGKCTELGDDLFDLNIHIERLNVGGTNLFMGSQNILKPLKSLKRLDIDNLAPYKHCPSKARELFKHLPKNLTHLSMRRWEDDEPYNKSCLLSTAILSSLQQLHYLSDLDMGYGNQVLGSEVESFPSLKNLEYLGISFGRLDKITPNAFAELKSLQSLDVNGNYLGSNSLPVSNIPLVRLARLSMRSTSIRSDAMNLYHARGIMCSYPSLEIWELSSNFLSVMPILHSGRSCNISQLKTLSKFQADHNTISSFLTKYKGENVNICSAFPNLRELGLNNNRLRDLRGLEQCRQLERLNLNGNGIGYSFVQYQSGINEVLQNLINLEFLDLSNNELNDVHASLIHPLRNLSTLYLQSNNIKYIDQEFFKCSNQLEQVDLSHNLLTSLTASMFSNMTKLETLNLAGNLITSFPNAFLDMVDNAHFLTQFRIGGNPYSCECGQIYFQEWLKRSTKAYIDRSEAVICSTPASQKGNSVYNYTDNDFRCNYLMSLIICISIVATAAITTVIVLPCYKYRWYIVNIKTVWKVFWISLQNAKLEFSSKYDAFVSYDTHSDEDQTWIVDKLLRNIEDNSKEERYSLYVEGRDAPCGQSRLCQREKALRCSRKILIVASNSYLTSTHCMSEADIAGYQMHGTKFYQRNRIMVLVRGDLCEEEIIRPPMSSLLLGTVIQVETSGRKEQLMWKKIRSFLAKPDYITQISHKREDSHTVKRGTNSSFSLRVAEDSDCEMIIES